MQVAIVIFICIAFIGISIYLGSKVKTLDDYYVAGRNAGVFIVTGTLLASLISTGTMVGQAEQIFISGPMKWNFIWWMFFGFMILFFGPGLYMRRKKVRTVSDFLSDRFNGSKKIRLVSAVIIIIGMLAFNVSMFLGIGVVLAELFQSSTAVGILIATGLTVFIALIGGQMSVVVTDTIMFIMFAIVGVLMFPLLANEAGGWVSAVNTMEAMMPGYMLTLKGSGGSLPSTMFFICNIGLFSFFSGTGADPRSITRTFVAKNEKTVLRTALLSSLLGLIFIFFFQTSVGIIHALAPNIEPRTAFAYATLNLVPPVIGSIAMAGLIFAGVSTATTSLSLGAFSIATDIIKGIIKPDIEDKKLMKISSVCIIILALISTVIALTEPAVLFYITIFGQGLFVATFLPAFIVSCYWKKATEKGIIWGMVAGVVAYFGITLLNKAGISLPGGFHQAHYALVISTATLVLVSLATKPSKESLDYIKSMKGVTGNVSALGTVATFDKSDKIFVTCIVTGSLILMGILSYLFYFIPLN